MKKFFKSSGWILLYLTIYFLLQTIYIFSVSIFTGIKLAIQNPEFATDPSFIAEEIQTMLAGQIPVSLIVSSIIAFGIYYLICKGRKQNIFEHCQFAKISMKNALMLVPTGVSLVFINSFLLNILNKTGLLENAFDKHTALMEQLLGGNTLVVFLSVAVAAPLIEEVIFRGLIFKELRKNMSIKWAILIQAILFGLYHMQLVQGIYSFLMGILFGLVCVWLKSIWPAVILHLFNNLTSVILSKMNNLDVLEALEIPIIIVSIVIVSWVCVTIYKNRIIEDEDNVNDIGETPLVG